MINYVQCNIGKEYSDNWSTPSEIYQKFIEQDYYDPCPLDEKYVDNLFYLLWPNKRLFINPPYSNIKEWVDHAIYHWVNKNKEVVLLVPSRTDTIWFHKLLDLGAEFHFIKGRLKFGESKNSAPFPSVIIILKELN